jgi:hypothetical protein
MEDPLKLRTLMVALALTGLSEPTHAKVMTGNDLALACASGDNDCGFYMLGVADGLMASGTLHDCSRFESVAQMRDGLAAMVTDNSSILAQWGAKRAVYLAMRFFVMEEGCQIGPRSGNR